MKRPDDYKERGRHLAALSDERLHERFWELAKRLTDPLLELGREYTSPSVERSVLLRMGFSSLEANALVEAILEQGLLGHGAGHVVYRAAREYGLTVRQAGEKLMVMKDWAEVKSWFREGERHG